MQRGPTLDGLGRYYREVVEESPQPAVDVAAALRASRADVLVSYLPVGSEQAQRYYAQAALDAGVAFVNAIPVFIASDPEWAARFTEAGVPIIGDDIKSQVGSTIVHRILTRLFEDRGLALDRTYQLNVGGNMDFRNMLERERLESKKISKTQAVTSQIEHAPLPADDVHIGPSDHVPWLGDRKWAYVRMEGRNFGDVPLNLELKLEVWDSPNSAGVIIDAVRCAKLALDRGIGGPLFGPSAYFMKSPPDAVPRRRGTGPRGALHRRGLRSGRASESAPSLLPPHVESPGGLVRAERALIDPELEQVVERLADHPARRHAEVRHDLVAVEVGPDGVELLPLSQLLDAALQLVHASGQRTRLGRVARRAVASGQLVEVVELVAGVTDVAAHGLVGPPQPVGVETQMELDQPRHAIDHVVGIPQGGHAGPGHAGADHLVMVERDPSVDESSGPGLADVVEQRSEPEQTRRGFVLSTTARVWARTSL